MLASLAVMSRVWLLPEAGFSAVLLIAMLSTIIPLLVLARRVGNSRFATEQQVTDSRDQAVAHIAAAVARASHLGGRVGVVYYALANSTTTSGTAELLHGALRAYDQLICYDDHGYVAVVSDIDEPASIQMVAERLELTAMQLSLRGAVRWTAYPDDLDGPQQLVERAQLAARAALNDGDEGVHRARCDELLMPHASSDALREEVGIATRGSGDEPNDDAVGSSADVRELLVGLGFGRLHAVAGDLALVMSAEQLTLVPHQSRAHLLLGRVAQAIALISDQPDAELPVLTDRETAAELDRRQLLVDRLLSILDGDRPADVPAMLVDAQLDDVQPGHVVSWPVQTDATGRSAAC